MELDLGRNVHIGKAIPECKAQCSFIKELGDPVQGGAPVWVSSPVSTRLTFHGSAWR